MNCADFPARQIGGSSRPENVVVDFSRPWHFEFWPNYRTLREEPTGFRFSSHFLAIAKKCDDFVEVEVEVEVKEVKVEFVKFVEAGLKKSGVEERS